MDHSIITLKPILRAAMMALLLVTIVRMPVEAQEAVPRDRPAEVGGTRPHPARHSTVKAPAAGTEAWAGDAGADDPESRPVAAYNRPPSSAPTDDSSGLAISVLGKTGLVVALMLVCAAGWKRLRGAAPLAGLASAQAVQVTSTVPIGPQRFLHLVTIGRHQLLVGSSPQSVTLIATLDNGAQGASELELAARPGLSPQRMAAEDDPGAAEREEPADRFEELLLRLRDLEAGPSAPEPAGASAEGRQPARTERDARPRVGAPLEVGWMGRAGGESAPPPHAVETNRPLAPGSLFRTSNSTGTPASHRREGIDE